MKAIALTNHGNLYNWVTSKNICDEYGIKFIFGVEIYLTEQLEPKVRDNYHTVLLAKNEQGIKEICSLVSLSNRKDHKYFKPRITFDEFKNISSNVIKTSACLSSPLWRLYKDKRFDDVADLAKHYDYLEIQPHLISEQATFNQVLLRLSKKFGIPLIAGTDTHSLDSYKAECRTLMMISKEILFKDRKSESDDGVDTEEQCDLTFKTYDELVEMFDKQGVLPRETYLEAIENTNRMSDMVEDFVLDTSFKYPVLYDDEVPRTKKLVMSKLKDKIQNHVIPMEQVPSFLKRIKEEFAVFEKIEMVGFMLFMSELVTWIKSQGMPVGTGRGSCLTAGNLVLTSNGYVPIEEVKVGDYVYTHKGRLQRVTDTQKFNVYERLYTFEYQGQGGIKNYIPLTCTSDHKLLTMEGWKEAKDITLDDYFYYPFLENKNKANKVFDLYEYVKGDSYFWADDEFVYEKHVVSQSFDYSSHDMNRKGICSTTTIKRIMNMTNFNRPIKENEERILSYTPFSTLEEYSKYLKEHAFKVKKIKRYLEMDSLSNEFIGIMFGDGYTHPSGIAVAVNKTNKYDRNGNIVKEFMFRQGFTTCYENVAKNGKSLVQIYFYSKLLKKWFETEFFKSKKKKDKILPKWLLEQSIENLNSLYNGLFYTDGSSCRANRISFDNTSFDLIFSFKILNDTLNKSPLALDYRSSYTDKRNENWVTKPSYKLRSHSIKSNWLRLEEIKISNEQETTVYDITVEDDHSFIVNNIASHNCCGSTIAYLLDITDVNPVKWNTIFSRFANEYRKELGDYICIVVYHGNMVHYQMEKC